MFCNKFIYHILGKSYCPTVVNSIYLKQLLRQCSSYHVNPSNAAFKDKGIETNCKQPFDQSGSTATDIISQPKSHNKTVQNAFTKKIKNGPNLLHFIQQSVSKDTFNFEHEHIYRGKEETALVNGPLVFIETYGCQMNVNDTEIAWSILKENGYRHATSVDESDIVLLMTCSIREGAEQKIWNRLNHLRHIKNKRRSQKKHFTIGVLGCMAERLKKKLVEQEKSVDVVCGPDAYRDLPQLLAMSEGGLMGINVQLSLEETYGDVVPVRLSKDSSSAFVSIMRGCDNMCSYCIVPFTRGRERSRDIESIVREVKMLSDQGVKEVTLLGQNVNSYRDMSQSTHNFAMNPSQSKGFKTVYKPKKGGRRFSELLERVSEVDPEMRIRFTSPHPKDFPDEVLYLIRDRKNICNHIHLPAQSGSSEILEAMRRGYTREAYLELARHIKHILPDVSLSSDFIAGFCGESEDDHKLTRSLMDEVKYNFAFCFPYSMRGKTHAYHRLEDDVADDVKRRRHQELIQMFRNNALLLNTSQIDQVQLVLVEGVSKRSNDDLAGRNDGNTKVIFPRVAIEDTISNMERTPSTGDYVAVKITGASSQVLKGEPLYHTTLATFGDDSHPLQQHIL